MTAGAQPWRCDLHGVITTGDCPKCDDEMIALADDNVVRPTIWQENAGLAASRDRIVQADLVLDVAVKDAIALIRDGRPGRAHFRLARAQERAGRILGPTDWTTRVGGAR